MKAPLLVAGAAVLVAGIAGAAWANSVLATATTRFMSECFGYPFQGGLDCPSIIATMSTYGAYQWLFILVGVVGAVLLLLGAILPLATAPPAAAYAPMAAPPPVPSAPIAAPPPTAAPQIPTPPWPAAQQWYPCLRCGHRLEWSSDYDRWHCPNCGAWA